MSDSTLYELDEHDAGELRVALEERAMQPVTPGFAKDVYDMCLRFHPRHRLRPVLIREGEVAKLLREMASAIDAGESFEGSIEYLIPDLMRTLSEDEWAALPADERDFWEATDESTRSYRIRRDVCEVRGVYRVGNDMGQGGVVMVGELAPPVHESQE